MSSITDDLSAYDAWLATQCAVVADDVDARHRRMRKSAFDFLRATYFRWARTIEAVCPALASASPALCIGDIHIENYGTWRDADARLVWGINDFDEAAVMPFAYDLVRLATSALLAPGEQFSASDACEAVLRGYAAGLDQPRAILLDQDQGWLRDYANPSAKSNADFWQEVDKYPTAVPPDDVKKALKDALPDGARVERWASRRRGGGGLGRPRFVVIATWNSGRVVREAKALVPSAWDWAHGSPQPSRCLEVAFGPYRSPDPHLHAEAGYILRRIAPDSRKIEIGDVQAHGFTQELLAMMATDLASVHAASAPVKDIQRDLASWPERRLRDAVKAAKDLTETDFKTYA